MNDGWIENLVKGGILSVLVGAVSTIISGIKATIRRLSITSIEHEARISVIEKEQQLMSNRILDALDSLDKKLEKLDSRVYALTRQKGEGNG